MDNECDILELKRHRENKLQNVNHDLSNIHQHNHYIFVGMEGQ